MADPSFRTVVLFICTANTYRSRYAEAYFNHQARARGIPVRAISRGLNIDVSDYTTHPTTEQALLRRGIPRNLTAPAKQALSRGDMEAASIVIAMYGREHRPLLRRQYPDWAARARYWNVPDIPDCPAEEGTAAIEENVDRLIEELGG